MGLAAVPTWSLAAVNPLAPSPSPIRLEPRSWSTVPERSGPMVAALPATIVSPIVVRESGPLRRKTPPPMVAELPLTVQAVSVRGPSALTPPPRVAELPLIVNR